jgi:hypothetical protein
MTAKSELTARDAASSFALGAVSGTGFGIVPAAYVLTDDNSRVTDAVLRTKTGGALYGAGALTMIAAIIFVGDQYYHQQWQSVEDAYARAKERAASVVEAKQPQTAADIANSSSGVQFIPSLP